MQSKADKIAALRDAISSMESSFGSESEYACEEAGQCEETESVFSRIVRLSSFRDRSSLELRKRLTEEGFEPAEIDAALVRACRCGLVDDMRFADARIRSLVRKGKGVKSIESDLNDFGIRASSVPGWPFDYLGDEGQGEYERALGLLRAKPSRSKDPFRGAYSKLMRNGYSSEVAYRAARRWVGELEQ